MQPLSELVQEPGSFRRNSPFLVFVGTYTAIPNQAGLKSEGIYVYHMDSTTGELILLQVVGSMINPSFLAIHPNGKYLYAVNEVDQFESQPGGGVSAFSMDARTGKLVLLNRQLSQGVDPCHLRVDATGRYVLVANYSSGSLSMLPIDSDGKLLPAVEVVQHYGTGPNPDRQEGPHVHSANLDPGNRFALIADLGLDRIMVYQLDLEKGKLVPQIRAHVQGRAGSGPRHLDFHPNGRFVYLVNELNSTLSVYEYHSTDSTLREIQVVPTLPVEYRGTNLPADIHITPNGKFVYASNRGHDSLAIFAVDEENGHLKSIGHQTTLGMTPRNFAIDPRGSCLLAANQDSGTIVTFRIEEKTGKLSPTGKVTQVPAPVCIKIFAEEFDVRA